MTGNLDAGADSCGSEPVQTTKHVVRSSPKSTDRIIIDKELRELRILMDAAMRANLALFDKTMRLHGRTKAVREAALEDARLHEGARMQEALKECESALLRDGHTIQ